MSCWTHIVAVFDVDTYIEDKNIKEIVEGKLANAPKITGSERNADVFVNVKGGHNVWTNCDCKICPHKETLIYEGQTKSGLGSEYSCKPDEGFVCPEGKYQTRVVITIVGDLRDREKETTKEEYKAFLKYLKKNCDFEIRNKSVNIIG
jgi:hypothetical protein